MTALLIKTYKEASNRKMSQEVPPKTTHSESGISLGFAVSFTASALEVDILKTMAKSQVLGLFDKQYITKNLRGFSFFFLILKQSRRVGCSHGVAPLQSFVMSKQQISRAAGPPPDALVYSNIKYI